MVIVRYDLKKQRCYLMAQSLGAKVNEHLVLSERGAEPVDDSEVEAFEALLAESITTVTSTGKTATTTTIEGVQSVHINAYNRHKYEYTFDDEGNSRSDCSGGDYRNRSSEDEITDDDDDNDDGDKDQDDYGITGEDDGSRSSGASGSTGNGDTRMNEQLTMTGKKKHTRRKKRERPTTHLVAAKYGTSKVLLLSLSKFLDFLEYSN